MKGSAKKSDASDSAQESLTTDKGRKFLHQSLLFHFHLVAINKCTNHTSCRNNTGSPGTAVGWNGGGHRLQSTLESKERMLRMNRPYGIDDTEYDRYYEY